MFIEHVTIWPYGGEGLKLTLGATFAKMFLESFAEPGVMIHVGLIQNWAIAMDHKKSLSNCKITPYIIKINASKTN